MVVGREGDEFQFLEGLLVGYRDGDRGRAQHAEFELIFSRVRKVDLGIFMYLFVKIYPNFQNEFLRRRINDLDPSDHKNVHSFVVKHSFQSDKLP